MGKALIVQASKLSAPGTLFDHYHDRSQTNQ